MYPYFFGQTWLPSYIVMAVIGFAAAFGLAYVRRKKYGYKPADLVMMLCTVIIGLILGAKLLFIITELPAIFGNFGWEIIEKRVINGGFVFYGGVIGAMTAIYLTARSMKKDPMRMLNFAIPCFTAFHFFGRIGCMLEGCCYGIPSAFGFPVYDYATETHVTRVPTQLIEATVLAAITAFLLYMEYYYRKNGKENRSLLPLYILTYAPARFIIEIMRGDELRGVTDITLNYSTTDGGFALSFSLSTSQIISLILLLCLFFHWLFGKLNERKERKRLATEHSKKTAAMSDENG